MDGFDSERLGVNFNPLAIIALEAGSSHTGLSSISAAGFDLSESIQDGFSTLYLIA